MPLRQYRELAETIRDLEQQLQVAADRAASLAPHLTEDAIERAGSLRALGRQVGLSPTYLSRVRHGQARMYTPAFLKIVDSLNKENTRE